MLEFISSSGHSYKIDIIASLFFIVATFIVVTLIKNYRLKKLLRRFREGKPDGEFILKCEKEMKIYRARGVANVYDVLCGMLCSAHIENGNEAEFFKYLNLFKTTTPDIEQMIYILLIQYFSGESYTEIGRCFLADVKQMEVVTTTAKDVISEYAPRFTQAENKIAACEKAINNDFVKQVFRSFIEII